MKRLAIIVSATALSLLNCAGENKKADDQRSSVSTALPSAQDSDQLATQVEDGGDNETDESNQQEQQALRTWSDDSGLQWAVLEPKMNWCAANDITLDAPKLQGLLALLALIPKDLKLEDLDEYKDKIDMKKVSAFVGVNTIVSQVIGSGLMACLKDPGLEQKKGDLLDEETQIIKKAMTSINTVGDLTTLLSQDSSIIKTALNVGKNEEGCSKVAGEGWRMPSLTELKAVDQKKFLKAFEDAEDREFWTATTVIADPLKMVLADLEENSIDIDPRIFPPQVTETADDLGVDLEELKTSPAGAFTFIFGDKKEATASKHLGRNVVCVSEISGE